LVSQPSALISQLKAKRGFALLIVITLLSFVVVLLLGLAVYTRVETAVAGNTQRQAQARENALLGLNVALSQLQRYAGPDQRVTATAEAYPNGTGTRRFTGVWSGDPATGGTPLTWLVSGNELADADGIAAPLAVTPETALSPVTGVALVSTNTSRTANDVLAPLVPVTATGVPGVAPAAAVTIGRYAWWVGDQGVKAPVAVSDAVAAIDYAPFDSAELRSRIRQQIPLGAGAADATGTPVFEPRDSNNTPLIANDKIVSFNQFAFLKNEGNAALGLTRGQQNFHVWSPNNYAVLANTKLGGLRQDLSLAPGLLGSAFAAWANYPAYMEKLVPDPPATDSEGNPIPTTTVPPPAIQPAYGSDPLRRRYKMQLGLTDQGIRHAVAPVLAECGLSFNIRTQNGKDGPLEVRVRWYVSLWNPYSSALVPEKNMRLEIEGLPEQTDFVVTFTPRDQTLADLAPHIHARIPVRLYDLFQDATHPDWKFPLSLAWDEKKAVDQPDMQSWLPGRVYTWISTEHSLTPTTSGGLTSAFYETNFSKVAGQGDTRDTGSDSIPADDSSSFEVGSSVSFPGPVQLVAKLYRSADDTSPLAVFAAPDFQGVQTTDGQQKPGAANYQFGFIFRLFESGHVDIGDKSAWLAGSEAVDPRSSLLPANAFRLDPQKVNDPAQYQSSLDFNDPKYLLDRTQSGTGSQSYNEDVPLFELPRAPILSLGALQHLLIDQARPFAIGNSWGAQKEIAGIPSGQLFDRFFFSGLVDGVTPGTTATGDLILPNPLLKPLRTWDPALAVPAYRKPTIDDIRVLMNPPTTTTIDPDGNEVITPTAPASSHSSKFFLQGGAFNLNSVNPAAWASVLRGVRFPTAGQAFKYLDASEENGTADDAATASVQSTDAQFFRFPQSAQETYNAEPGKADNDPDVTSPANTHLFRQGKRTLSIALVGALATKVVELVGMKHAADGPFRSLDEFLSPNALFAGVDSEGNAGSPRSLLEAAIADAGVNAEIAEFSSQWLTQGDVMTVLAPVLFPRSDTFVIRAYGEAVNPALSTPAVTVVEGRAWCEAIVQRLPEYFDRSDPPEMAPAAFDTPSNPDDPESQPTDAHKLNKLFGRRFKVLSFRWLTRSDI
jgi:hypothetical protein